MFSIFFVFNHDFIIGLYIDFTRIAASNTSTDDDVTKNVTHTVFDTNLQYSCAHFVMHIDEKSSLTSGFNAI